MTIVPVLLRQIKFYSRHLQLRNLNQNTSDLKWKRIKDFKLKMPKHRENPVIMTLDSPEFKSIFTEELNILTSLFKKYNYEMRVAGGAVRDLLSGKIPKDLDFATTATPNQMKELFTKEEIRMLNTKGEKHGTITARINDKENFEVTTLRIDVVTDGRHADIEFTTDWKLDANRRDLTINSMFLDFDGKVYDYFFGHDDLINKRVTFVGDPAIRICEDFLRILRYFRFYGRISEHPDNHEINTINAIKDNVSGLEKISGERIWNEWNKILEGNFGIELTKKMIECGMAKYIGLPENPDIENFEKICSRAKQQNEILHPIAMIIAMLNNSDDAMNLHKRLHWSSYNRDLAFFLITHRNEKTTGNPLHPYQYILLNTTGKIKDIKEYIVELLKYRGTPQLAKQFQEWIPPKFPVNGNDLIECVPNPKMIGRIIMKLKKIWVDQEFNVTKEKLMDNVPQIINELNENWSLKRKNRE